VEELFIPPELHLLILPHNPSKASRCKVGIIIIYPAKPTSNCFPSRVSRCNFGGKIIYPAIIASTHFASQSKESELMSFWREKMWQLFSDVELGM
jgi:hypothetical protein